MIILGFDDRFCRVARVELSFPESTDMPPKAGGIGGGFARPAPPGSSTATNATAGPSTGAAAGGDGNAAAAGPPKPKMKFKPVLQPKKVKAE